MYRIHHLQHSRSHRIVWLMEELGLSYEIVRYERNPQTLCAPEELREVHPLGKAPLLEDDDRVIAESANIINYLLDRHAHLLRPSLGTRAYEDYRYWMNFSEGTAMALVFARLIMVRATDSNQVPTLVRPFSRRLTHAVNEHYFHPEISRLTAFLAQHLSEHEYFVADRFTAADIQMAYPVRILCKGQPALKSWLERVSQRPAQMRAQAQGCGIDLPVDPDLMPS